MSKDDTELIARVKKRFQRCQEFENKFRQQFVADIEFAHGDSDNNHQWNGKLVDRRKVSGQVCLTINKTRQHNLQIINDAKQNKPGVSVHPVSTEASFEAAQVFEGIIRHIEYISNAQVAYDTATEFQVEGGIGYWRILTDYAHSDSLDQELFIRRIKDPLSVYLDPDINELDGSDAQFGLIFEDHKHDEFKRQYPQHQDLVNADSLMTLENGRPDTWLYREQIRVAEYFEVTVETETLVALPTQNGSTQMAKLSELDESIQRYIKSDNSLARRKIETKRVDWYLIAGDTVIDRRAWLGQYIPIVRVVGEEKVFNGKLERKGHTRALKGPQSMYNYWASAAVEQVVMQGKQPYIGSTRAFEGVEKYWDNANIENYSRLPYNDVCPNTENPIAAPQRQAPPQMASAYIEGMRNAAEELKMVSGQYDPTMGANSRDQSGVALYAQQRKGDKATYHYIDHLAVAIRFTGKILIDLIPKVYDTPRIIRILGEDGQQSHVQLDPQHPQALQEQPSESNQVAPGQNPAIKQIFNPNVGVYDVIAESGPGYETRRQETFTALTQIASNNPQIMQVAGDLIMRAADFPMADELAERLARMVPANIKGDGPGPEVEQAQQQIQQLQQALQHSTDELNQIKASHDIDQYQAETDRMKALAPAINPQEIAQLVAQLVTQALQESRPNQPLQGQSISMQNQQAGPEPPAPTSPLEQPPSGGFFTPEHLEALSPERPGFPPTP